MIKMKNMTPKKIPEIKALIRQGTPYVDVQHDYNYWLLALCRCRRQKEVS